MHAKMRTPSGQPPRSALLTRAIGPVVARAPAKSRLAEAAARLPERQITLKPAGVKPVLAKTVGSFVPRLTRPAFERYGFSAAALITDWDTIVGADVARYTRPDRLKWPRRVEWTGEDVADAEKGRPGATLMLAVAQGRALDVEYKAAQLVERINAYFGYRAVAGIKILQVAAIGRGAAQISTAGAGGPRPVARPDAAKAPELARVEDPGLRAALERMAQGIGSRKLRGAAAA